MGKSKALYSDLMDKCCESSSMEYLNQMKLQSIHETKNRAEMEVVDHDLAKVHPSGVFCLILFVVAPFFPINQR